MRLLWQPGLMSDYFHGNQIRFFRFALNLPIISNYESGAERRVEKEIILVYIKILEPTAV